MVNSILILVLLAQISIAQVILSEIMNNPAGGETSIPGGDSNEYIELYNAGSDTVDLSGWSFDDGDASDDIASADGIIDPLPDDPDGIYNSTSLPPGGFALILDPEYTDPANDQPYDWPTGTIILTIATSTDLGGSRLATTDPITLYDDSSTPTDSFPNPFDPGDGVSVERDEPALSAGWSSSIAPSGSTPGARNSHWPYGTDLALDSLTTPDNPATSSPITVYAFVTNVGEAIVSSATVSVFRDTSETELLDSETITNISVDETREVQFELTLTEGSFELFAALSGDDNSTNDYASLSILVGPTGWPVCISEIMFMPTSGEPEWIELYNWSDVSVDLEAWQFGDENSLYDIPPCTLEPGGFVVLCEDTAAFPDTLCDGALLLQPSSWPALNNTGDIVRIFDDSGLPRHSIAYTDDQFGTCMDNGISAETIEEGGSQVACSPGGRTPGCENAIWLITPGGRSVYADPNPFDPTREATMINVELPGGGLDVCIYDRMGRKIANLADPGHPVGLSFPWNGADDSGDLLPAGMYILFVKDSEGNSAKAVVAIEGSR